MGMFFLIDTALLLMSQLLIIDNYDSFTYNLLHYFGELGATVTVIRNDAMSADDVIKQNADGIVLSPGPCTPDEAGICVDVVKKAAGKIPLFGVCLGHQSIAQAFGGKIIRAEKPMHGKVSSINRKNSGVFKNLPSPFNATRYHSLVVDRESLPDCFDITAETQDRVIMGLEHKEYSIHGVQFHPESIASEQGHALLKNFLELL